MEILSKRIMFTFGVVQTYSFKNQNCIRELKNFFFFFCYILAKYSHIVTSSCFGENSFHIWRYELNKKDSDGHIDLLLHLSELLKWKFILLGWCLHYLVQFHC